ncbi:metallophosphoesterase [Sphingobacterium paludis]|uniref:Serine/threonine protein phosphatase 1 n=1 Tax=Sphingobacterium paludis TaxID=1476465 RepID=A0A4R7D0C7_9SPHI|nr:metallophosphoesterase [Sphingobacterium paludis]TDS12945.1 serine/threonine protein phosphatase 1 [Sphingobacterium paludis]
MDRNDARTFVMGDIHGAYKALVQCLAKSQFNYERDTLIQLGDITDGQDEVFECVEELLKIKNLIAIKGNHDVWFKSFIDRGQHARSWNFGGIATLRSYLRHMQPNGIYTEEREGYSTSLRATSIPYAHAQLFQRQKLYYIDAKDRLFIHAGYDRGMDFYGQPEDNYYFDRSLWMDTLWAQKGEGRGMPHWSKEPFDEIFIGHTSTTKWGVDQPMTAFNITNVDTGAGHKGRLTIMDVDSKEYWQSSPIPVLYH